MSSISGAFQGAVDPITPTSSKDMFSEYDMSLPDAVREGSREKVCFLLKNQENAGKSKGFPLLIQAICNNQQEIAKVLLENMNYFNDIDDQFVLYYTAEIRDFFCKGVFENLDMTLLRKALYENHLQTAELLIKNMRIESLNAQDELGETVLHFAAETNQVDIIKALIDRGVDLNKQHRRTGRTPLIYAVRFGYEEAASKLINKMSCAELNTKDKEESWTAKQFATSINERGIIKAIENRLEQLKQSLKTPS